MHTDIKEIYEWNAQYESINKKLKRKVDNMVQVGVVRKKDIIQSVKTSVDLAGGMKIKKNSTVLIRPNANTADYPPGSTNPEVPKTEMAFSAFMILPRLPAA